MIYHIASAKEWEQCQADEAYAPARFDQDGFIHCSTAGQVKRIADTILEHQHEIWLLCIDEEAEKGFIKYENLEGGDELFPHIYRKLPKRSIRKVIKIASSSGTFHFPPEITS